MIQHSPAMIERLWGDPECGTGDDKRQATKLTSETPQL